MEMTLEGGFTLQRTLPRRVAGWITIAEGVGWNGETENADTIFLLFFSFLFFSYFWILCYDVKKIVEDSQVVRVSV